ncbi:MAG: MFS transporter [Gammaproteobacteria bacterium]|nr:MAG: MFS transporter [Gammaproteobacteria bacterium]
MRHGVPYARISFFYASYFAAIGILAPYIGLYLRHRGFDALAIGQLLAILMAMRIMTPALWGWLADVSGRRMMLLRVAAITAPLCFVAVAISTEWSSLAFALAIFGAVWSGVLPSYEANTMNHLGDRPQTYGRLRMWGSAGFILAVICGGMLFDDERIFWFPAVTIGLLVLAAAGTALTPPASSQHHESDGSGLVAHLRKRKVAGLLLAAILLQASFGPYLAFFTIYLRDAGYSSLTAGFMWAWGTAAEIVVFAYTPRLLNRWTPHGLLTAALAVTSIRWVMTGLFPGSLTILLAAQTLHMASFGVFHAVAVVLIHRYFGGTLQTRGQALYSSLGFGVGGALGSLWAGYVWEFGEPVYAWMLAALVAVAAAIVAWASTPPPD